MATAIAEHVVIDRAQLQPIDRLSDLIERFGSEQILAENLLLLIEAEDDQAQRPHAKPFHQRGECAK